MTRELIITLLLFIFVVLASQNIDTDDCECITRWQSSEIHCNASYTINTLQSFLALKSKGNCMESCHQNILCQQAFSLLRQYQNKCPLGIVSEAIINAYYVDSTCMDCKVNDYYYSGALSECSNVTNCSSSQITASSQYIKTNCNNQNISSLSQSNECNSRCQTSWDYVSSYRRQCVSYPNSIDYELVDILQSDNTMDCTTDCNLSFDESYNGNCSNTNYTKLDIEALEKETKLCFYGLNIDDPFRIHFILNRHTHLASSNTQDIV